MLHHAYLPRRLAGLALLFLSGSFAASCAAAGGSSAYPDRPITIVVPFAAGGPVDIVARAIANPLARILKTSVIVENAPGASGVVGAAKVARSPADGYTLLLGTAGTQALNPHIYKKMPYRSPQDFQPVAELASIPSVLSVGAAGPYADITQFVDKLRSEPGAITLGNAGPGSVSNLAALTFLAAARGRVTAIPYKGTAPAFVDLMGGQIDALFDTAVQAIPHIRGGKVRAIATTAPSRLASLPDVPTLDESCCKGAALMIWYGLLAPAGLPAEVSDRLAAAVVQAREDAQYQETMRAGEAVVPPADAGPKAFAAIVERDVARFGELVRQAGVVPE